MNNLSTSPDSSFALRFFGLLVCAASLFSAKTVYAESDPLKKLMQTNNCVACHQPNGKGGGAIKALDGSAVVLNSEAGKEIHVLLNGQNNNSMPAWKQLSDSEIAAVISFTKNNWSNKTGQMVQPAQVLAARQ